MRTFWLLFSMLVLILGCPNSEGDDDAADDDDATADDDDATADDDDATADDDDATADDDATGDDDSTGDDDATGDDDTSGDDDATGDDDDATGDDDTTGDDDDDTTGGPPANMIFDASGGQFTGHYEYTADVLCETPVAGTWQIEARPTVASPDVMTLHLDAEPSLGGWFELEFSAEWVLDGETASIAEGHATCYLGFGIPGPNWGGFFTCPDLDYWDGQVSHHIQIYNGTFQCP